MGDMDK